MKRSILLFVMVLNSTLLFAQDYGKYSIPQTELESELQRYVGQRVKIFHRLGGHSRYLKDDEVIFEKQFKGCVTSTYKIKKVKVDKYINFDLLDEKGKGIKVKINKERGYNPKCINSCRSFFLVDAFEEDSKKYEGMYFKNFAGEKVAQVQKLTMVYYEDKYPIPLLLVKSNLDESLIRCTKEQAEKIFYPLGQIIFNDKVKNQYKVIGVNDSQLRPIDMSNIVYNVVNTTDPKDIRQGTITNPEETIFKTDLRRSYKSTLSKVEKPNNPQIRYGKTTIVQDSGLTKYSYVDNVINILIFGGSEQFVFSLKNVSDNLIKLIWNEAVFVDFDGSTSKVMHNGIKFSQREENQPATIIIKGAKIEDMIVPNCNVRYSDALYKWVTDSMYPKIPGQNPGQLKLMLPIQIKDVINEYVFVFDVNYSYDHPEKLNQ